MKIKTDYVTNSSSASYLLYIKSEYDDLEDFKKSFNKYMDDYIKYNHSDEDPPRFFNPRDVSQISSNTFLIVDWNSMYNDFHDVPRYMLDLILNFVVEKETLRSNYKFKSFTFRVVGDDND